MDEWWTYDLSDLILFSSRTYYRLIELYNLAIWPIQILALSFTIVIVFAVLKRPAYHGKLIATTLVISWLWVAWAFLWHRFASIHWIASYYAIGFVIQSILLIWTGLVKDGFKIQTTASIQNKPGFVTVLYGLVIQPFIMIPAGQNWKAAELFMLTPDSTIIVTMGIILLTDLRKTAGLLVIPLLWCIVSAATLYALSSISSVSLIITALLTSAILIFQKSHSSRISQ